MRQPSISILVKKLKVRETVKSWSPRDIFYTEMCRISVRTTLVFTPKVDIPDFLTLFLKIGFPKWGEMAPLGPGPWALALALAPALALALGGPGGPWGALALAWPWPWPCGLTRKLGN